jgi:hypothetical protein
MNDSLLNVLPNADAISDLELCDFGTDFDDTASDFMSRNNWLERGSVSKVKNRDNEDIIPAWVYPNRL